MDSSHECCPNDFCSFTWLLISDLPKYVGNGIAELRDRRAGRKESFSALVSLCLRIASRYQSVT